MRQVLALTSSSATTRLLISSVKSAARYFTTHQKTFSLPVYYSLFNIRTLSTIQTSTFADNNRKMSTSSQAPVSSANQDHQAKANKSQKGNKKDKSTAATTTTSEENNDNDAIQVIDGKQIVQEGTVRMEYDLQEKVFYNKVQVLNRDLSIQTIKLFSETLIQERNAKYRQKLTRYEEHVAKYQGEHPEEKDIPKHLVAPTPPSSQGIKVLDALAASGLRSLRYLKEIPLVEHVTINDLSSEATNLAEENREKNGIDKSRVLINNGDAIMFMYMHKDEYDVIDLDPYGTVVPFLDSAVQAVKDGGLLCVTCTDMTVLGGTYPEVAFAKYHSMPVRGKYLHEMSLRMLLHSIDSTANKYKRHIVPWLSLSVDFYVRVFVRVYESPAEVKQSSLRRCMLYQSLQCPSFYLQTLGGHNKQKSNFSAPVVTVPSTCPETGGRMKVGGPFWSAPIHNQEVVDTLLARVKEAPSSLEEAKEMSATEMIPPIQTSRRLGGMLTAISEELKDIPFYYSLPELASTVQCHVPTYLEFENALRNAGYRVSQFHHDPSAVKTDAPIEFIWDVMRAYCKIHPPKEDSKKGLSVVAKAILAKEIKHEVDFTINQGRQIDKTVPRFMPNPEANWGPKRRAGRLVQDLEKQRKQRESESEGEEGGEEAGEGGDEPDTKRARSSEEKK